MCIQCGIQCGIDCRGRGASKMTEGGGGGGWGTLVVCW